MSWHFDDDYACPLNPTRGLVPARSLAARTSVVVLHCRVGGPLVFPRTSGRLDILFWRVMPRRCPARTAALLLWRITHTEVASCRARARRAHCLPSSSCGSRGVGPSYPRFQGAGLSAPASPPAWHELAVAMRQKGDGGAVHAFFLGGEAWWRGHLGALGRAGATRAPPGPLTESRIMS